ncbi:NAD(P)H-dependent glycerol-3-phosphate dehydrogenase [Rothia aerolata]|uniref:Glycerol-3-phosphate dehydrogenase [NAD(P)+] n=1 Tax=Rothia aerolata TaxID=1812262 RepID=A0A917IPQ4_9MICC|nr:NAD(P)H-dependent glycerol-3-phosphate dehydrogenase [Rothia aerolata]GGH58863.1 glycerol-3-phosphate dehydrogenase [NAD(P)+] [Rothia aerolata]
MAHSVEKVAVLGAGSWGTAFAKMVADTAKESASGVSTVLWGRNEQRIADCVATGRNEAYFPGVALPESLKFTADLKEALTGADIVVLAVPAQSLRTQLEVAKQWIEPHAVMVSLAKGLEQGSGLRMSEVIAEVLQDGAASASAVEQRICVLSGPNLAKEIVAEQPTASVVAASTEEVARRVAEICACSYFRPYTGTDIIGVEIGGLVKNVIALCVGICEGKNYGDNSKASVMTRGLAETTRLALALGAEPATLSGLAGMGDLIATCSSPLSRNHTAGRLLAEGVQPADLPKVMSQTAESVKTAPVVAELARKHGVEMPITEAVVAVLSHRVKVEDLAPKLLGRSLKNENASRA